MHAVIGRVADPDAASECVVGIDCVEASAVATDDLQARQRLEDAAGCRRVLQQERIGVAACLDQLVFGLALCRGDFDAGGAKQIDFQRDVGEVVIGDKDVHEIRCLRPAGAGSCFVDLGKQGYYGCGNRAIGQTNFPTKSG